MDLLDDDGLLDLGQRARRTDPRAAVDELRPRDNFPERNSALSDWAANLGTNGSDSNEATCHLCARAGPHSCNQCGRAACTADYWVMYGLCRACAKDDRVHSAQRTPEPEATNWLGGEP